MTHQRLLAATLTLSLGFSLGCSSAEDSTPGTVSLPITLSGIVYDENNDAVEGVTVCVHDRDAIPCVVTDDLGQYDLQLPEGEDVAIHYTKDGHVPRLFMHHSDEDGFRFQPLQRLAYFDAQTALVGVPWDASTALLSIHAATGATVSFAPGAGDGPFYMNDDLDLDASLTATAEPGLGIFANVPAGTYTVTASHPGSTCAPDAWPSADGGGLVTALPGTLTTVNLTCK